MKTQAEVYKELKRLIIVDYEEDNRILPDDTYLEKHRRLSEKLKERIDALEWVLED